MKPVFGFLVLTFALTWALWGAAANLPGKAGKLWFLPGTITPSVEDAFDGEDVLLRFRCCLADLW